MTAIPLITGLIFLIAVARTQTRLERAEDPRAGSLSLLRMLLLLLTAVFSFALQQSSELGFEFLITSVALFVVWALQQLLGRWLGTRADSSAAANSAVSNGSLRLGKFEGALNAWAKLVKPIRLSTPEAPEDFEQEIFEAAEEFTETVVREVMVPRVDLEVVDADTTLEDALSIFVSTGYSRLPVVGKSADDVVGVLYLKDVARVTHQDPARLAVVTALEASRPALFTPESKPVADLLREMQLSSTQIAIVSDEYGGVAGVATMEDLIEELVGEISDEYDRDTPEIETLEGGSIRVHPRISIIELAEFFEIELDDPDVDSVGGLFVKALGHLPRGGETVKVDLLELVAERVEAKRQRIISILVRKLEN